MKSICKNMRNLKTFKTDNCYAVKDSLAEINRLKKIEILDLQGIGNKSDSVLLRMLEDFKPFLRELRLYHPITNDSMTKISENCPNLELLDLRFMHPIPQRGAQMIFKNLTNLKSLEFRKLFHAFSIDEIEDTCEFLGYSITNLVKLETLEINGINFIVGASAEEIAQLKNLKKRSPQLCERKLRKNIL